jgi:hypothetical protein
VNAKKQSAQATSADLFHLVSGTRWNVLQTSVSLL